MPKIPPAVFRAPDQAPAADEPTQQARRVVSDLHLPPVMFAKHIAQICSQEAGQPISPTTIWSYLQKSKPADPAKGTPAGRYADNPCPEPDGWTGETHNGNQPFWRRDRAQEWRDWWNARPGRGNRGTPAGRERRRTT